MSNDIIKTKSGISTSTLPPGAKGLCQIPYHSLLQIGSIFLEGEAKHGRDNWKKDPSDLEFIQDRLDHALVHLLLYLSGDRTENHRAKVAWAMIIIMELERLNNSLTDLSKPI